MVAIALLLVAAMWRPVSTVVAWGPAAVAVGTFVLLGGRLLCKTIDEAERDRVGALHYFLWNVTFNTAMAAVAYAIAHH